MKKLGIFLLGICGALILTTNAYAAGGTIAKYQVEKAKLSWSVISEKLVKNGWAQRISETKVRLIVKLDRTIQDQMAKVFGDDFPKLLPILRHANDWFALDVHVGTLGLGGDGIIKLSDVFDLRLGGNGFNYDYHGKETGIDYDVALRLMSFPLLLDWSPFQQGLHLTGGLVINQNHVNADARPSLSYTVGNNTYTAAQAGKLAGKIYFNKEAPYAGIGWGNPFGGSSSWSIGLDLGVMFQGTPKTKLSANGLLAENPTFQADLARQQDSLNNDFKKYKYYPVAGISLKYRF